MQNEEQSKCDLKKSATLYRILIFIVVYAAIRFIVEYGLGYKNVPFFWCAFALYMLIEAIRSKNRQMICTVFAVAMIIATFYVENVWLYWGLMASGIVTIIVGSRGCKSYESHSPSEHHR